MYKNFNRFCPPITQSIQFAFPELKEYYKKPSKKNTNYHAFTYIDYYKKNTAITEIWKSLKENHFISDETTISSFRKIFKSNKPVDPITWTGNISELYYFVWCLHVKYKLIENLGHDVWKITSKIFVDSKKNYWSFKEFRGLHKTAKAHLIEKAVEELN